MKFSERQHSIQLVRELLGLSETFEGLPSALRQGVAKVLRDYPSHQELVDALQPGAPTVTWQAQCAMIDARQLLECVACYCSSHMDRALIRCALRSYPETDKLIEAAAMNRFPQYILGTRAC